MNSCDQGLKAVPNPTFRSHGLRKDWYQGARRRETHAKWGGDGAGILHTCGGHSTRCKFSYNARPSSRAPHQLPSLTPGAKGGCAGRPKRWCKEAETLVCCALWEMQGPLKTSSACTSFSFCTWLQISHIYSCLKHAFPQLRSSTTTKPLKDKSIIGLVYTWEKEASESLSDFPTVRCSKPAILLLPPKILRATSRILTCTQPKIHTLYWVKKSYFISDELFEILQH